MPIKDIDKRREYERQRYRRRKNDPAFKLVCRRSEAKYRRKNKDKVKTWAKNFYERNKKRNGW